jgi:hypothetical protein
MPLAPEYSSITASEGGPYNATRAPLGGHWLVEQTVVDVPCC